MRTRWLRRTIVFFRVRCSILILLIKTVRCSIPHGIFIHYYHTGGGCIYRRCSLRLCAKAIHNIMSQKTKYDCFIYVSTESQLKNVHYVTQYTAAVLDITFYITKYSRTPLIRINWDGKPSGYTDNPDDWIFR
jgi:hypothetical protein